MEAASKKFRTVVAIVATIVVGAAMVQTIAPDAHAGDDEVRVHHFCPPFC